MGEGGWIEIEERKRGEVEGVKEEGLKGGRIEGEEGERGLIIDHHAVIVKTYVSSKNTRLQHRLGSCNTSHSKLSSSSLDSADYFQSYCNACMEY